MKTLSTERLILRDWCEDDIGCSVHNEDTIRSDFYYYMLDKNSNSF